MSRKTPTDGCSDATAGLEAVETGRRRGSERGPTGVSAVPRPRSTVSSAVNPPRNVRTLRAAESVRRGVRSEVGR
ncbi:hypothetical protein [Halogranum amylolyticum]|uniref:hypothetical protein n=1 Tax=Halogranum amylolyticum TaxID=660520 RepID=UPI00111500F6|nr:hypothetical protein [Halogranum amylolyticum]